MGMTPLLAEASVSLTTGNIIAIIAGIVIPLGTVFGTVGWRIAAKLASIDTHLAIRLPAFEKRLDEHDHEINDMRGRLNPFHTGKVRT